MFLDGRRAVAGVGLAVGGNLHQQLHVATFGEAEAGHRRLIEEEVGVTAEVGRRDEWVADPAGDGEGAVGTFHLEDEFVTHLDVVIFAGDALDADSVVIGPCPGLEG